MKLIRKTIIVILAIFSFGGAYSQTKMTIRGKVIDQNDKMPVIGATVIESDKDNRVVSGTITDVDGNFVYEMKNQENSLKVSVIGYQTQSFKPVTGVSITIELISSNIELEEVTISANVKPDNQLSNIAERDMAASRVKIDLKEMKNLGVTSAADALQGKVSGLDIMSASGDPGSGSQIVIRGLSSMGNNQPLIVIDGVPQDVVPSTFNLGSAETEEISKLINIALQDIKSIEVLKDAASAAIYGSKGADGVLLIETYKGRMGKLQFDYQYKYSVNFQPPPIPMLNGDEYIMLQREEWHNSKGVYEIPDEISYNKDYVDFYNYSVNTDWVGAITQNSVTNDHYFKITGGGEKTRYFTSLSYFDQGGTTINTGAKKISTRINLDYFLSKKIMFTVQFNYSNNQIDGNVEINNQNIREMAYLKAPNMSIYKYDENGKLTAEYFNPINNYQGDGYNYFNPVAVARLGKKDSDENFLTNSFRLKFDICDWLVFKETVSFQYAGIKGSEFLPYNAIGTDWLAWPVNNAAEGNSQQSSIKTESLLSYDVPFANADHVMSGTFSWITNKSGYKWLYLNVNKTPTTLIQDPSTDAQISWIGSGSGENSDLGALANWNYKYKDRYMLQTILRGDANSAFGANNRWGLFMGVMLGWRFSSEPFMAGLRSWMGDCMLRISWGTSGRSPDDPYSRFATYETTQTGNYIINPAIVATSIQLDQLKWESVTQTDIGLELNLFKNRLFIEADVYNKLTSDLLFSNYNLPTSSGFNLLKAFNGGKMQNKGWEIMTSYKLLNTQDWFVAFDFNTSRNINAFVELPENFNSERSTSIGNGEYPKRVVAGEPIGSFFGFRYKGVYASDADAIARDVNGNIMKDSEGNPLPLTYKGSYIFRGGDAIYEDINKDGKIDLNDAVYIGDSNPTVFGGFGVSTRYKNWDFSFNFFYRVGFDIINMIALQTEGMDGKNNQSNAVLNRWRTEGQNYEGILPRAYMDHPANNLGSDRYVEEGSFLRLNNIKLGYDLDKKFCNKLHMQSAYLSVSARKLFTITNYSGQDPEVVQNASDPFWVGVDYANTPPPRTVTISFAVGF